jgi:hypothetical protein
VTTASFTYLGVSFDTPNGSHGFVAANDGSAYENMVPNRVIIVGGTEHVRSGERGGFWLEFSPETQSRWHRASLMLPSTPRVAAK